MQTLAGRISSAEGLSAADAVGWVIRLAKTLEPIHALGVAHGAVSADAVQIQDASPTSVGHILTPRTLHDQPAYHSPERAGGEGTSPEDDTWAAAVTLYHVLTRRFPFPGDDDDAVEQLIRTTHPAPLRSFGIHDSGLQKILDDAFSRDILSRMTSMSAFREALEDWHFDPDVKQLSALWHEGSLLLALRPAPSRGHAGSAIKTGQVPAVQAFAPPPATPAPRAPVPVIHQDEEEEYEGPTRVRDTSQLLAQLAALKSSDPPSVRPVITDPPSTPVVSARPTPVVEAPSELLGNPSNPPLEGPADPDADPDGEGPTQIAGILPFDRDSAPKIAVGGRDSNPAQDRYLEPNPDAPILPFDRESAPPRSARPVEPRSDIAASAPPVAESAPPQNTRTANSVPPDRGAPVIAAPAPPAPSGKPPVLLLAGLLVFVAAAGTAFFLSRKPAAGSGSGEVGATTAAMSAPPTSTTTAAHSTHPTTASPTADATGTLAPTALVTATATTIEKPAQTAAPTATASVAPTATAVSTATTTATEAASTGAAACMMPLFATGTFVSPPAAFDGICQITDPREAVKMVKMQVILSGAGRLVSDGMREWAIIGWYGMPAVAAMRAVCCPGAAEMHITYNVPKCEVEAAMKRLLAASINPKSEDTEITDALKDYSKTVGCTADSGAAGAFGQKGGIVEGELVTFQKTLARVRAAVKAK